MKYSEYSSRFTRLWKEMPNSPKRQKELANLIECSQATVSDWINGEKLPSMDTAIRLSEIFGCCVEYLMTNKSLKHLKNNKLITKIC